MDNLNKSVSFILGLVVVLVFLAVLTGRLNLKKLPILSKSEIVSPTPKMLTYPTPTHAVSVVNKTYQTTKTATPSSIPATGIPTFVLPTLISALIAGFGLRRAAKPRNS